MNLTGQAARRVENKPGDPVPRWHVVVETTEGRRFERYFIRHEAPELELCQSIFEGETEAPHPWQEVGKP